MWYHANLSLKKEKKESSFQSREENVKALFLQNCKEKLIAKQLLFIYCQVKQLFIWKNLIYPPLCCVIDQNQAVTADTNMALK